MVVTFLPAISTSVGSVISVITLAGDPAIITKDATFRVLLAGAIMCCRYVKESEEGREVEEEVTVCTWYHIVIFTKGHLRHKSE